MNEEKRQEIEARGREAVDFAKFSLKIFDDVVLANSDYVKLITGDIYVHKTYNMGMVDAKNNTNFYDGKIRVTSPSGKEHAKYDCSQYREYVAERVEPWSYLKFPYLKKIGWKGFVDGEDSGVYKATPLSRCNAADGMATPLANAEYKRMYETLGGKPINHTLATHWARLVELLYAAERWVELAADPQITGKEYRVLPTQTPTDGVGCVEAPRGTLTHHYTTDERGILTKVNLIVGTTNNNAPDLHVGEKGSSRLDPQRPGPPRTIEHGRDGLPRLRSLLRLRHPQPARPNAPGSHHPRPAGRSDRNSIAVYLTLTLKVPSPFGRGLG